MQLQWMEEREQRVLKREADEREKEHPLLPLTRSPLMRFFSQHL